MIDQVKFVLHDSNILNQLMKNGVLVQTRAPNRFYKSYVINGTKIRIDCRIQLIEGIEVVLHSYINISPHYHSNSYIHNGNDLSVTRCIISIKEILNDYLGIGDKDFNELKICNIEFGVNIVPKYDTKMLVDNILFQKRKEFVKKELPHFKILNSSKNKQIKFYAKGLQCHEALDAKHIHPNTLRYEIKSKKSYQIKRYGIDSMKDLLDNEKYNYLSQILINEWDSILIINTDNLSIDYNGNDYNFLQDCMKKAFWRNMINSETTYRNKYSRYVNKYYHTLQTYDNMHLHIKGLIVDKLIHLKSGAFFPLENSLETNIHPNSEYCLN